MDSLNSIANNLRDPSWWFTTFIIGIIASVAAGFAKDYLETRFNLFLAWSRPKREQARLRKQESIEAWSKNESRVIIVLLTSVQFVILCFSFLTFIIVHLDYLKLRYGMTGITTLDKLPIQQAIWLLIVFLLTLWLSWRTVRILAYSAACLRRFCQSQGLR